VIARVDPAFFRQLYQFATDRYPTDRATYHVSAELSRIPEPAALADRDLAGLLDQFDARQVFHVTFGSLLDQFGAELKALLRIHEEQYYATLQAHFMKHLIPFV
jgi:tagaturonate epimerase